MRTRGAAASIFAAALLYAWTAPLPSAPKPEPIPHAQDRMPGPPLSPAEAIRKMKVPDGFTVELVASEPDIINPVAMTFDEKGRIWIAESLEYPRFSAGAGRDRIKVLEDTDGDGKIDKVTVFAEGLNIPSGIAVGHGGVWVANAPDILFLQDTDGDGKADTKEVVVTGFGRQDTHELPNSLTWGPDGYLYGLNGVFNPAHIRHQDKEHRFTCAMFRINPRTRSFEVFAEGTSNPWGIAWDNNGSAFVSACVIDHLWHLTESGYYFRQGGPYPPFTWVLGSIVRHKHQKAAYCGIHFFDGDAYPPEYRERLYMGNIHGGCINVDVLERDGSTYFARPAPDFLTANDPWFMPVVQKTGPDGCLYILDWYDRYHCYQDARRDPEGIDRGRGRLYRVRYKDAPRAGRFDLAKESDDQLIQRLHSGNVYFRDIAQRLLCERISPEIRAKLETLVLDEEAPRKARMHALWSLIGSGRLPAEFHLRLLRHMDPGYRAWAVRAAGNHGDVDQPVPPAVISLADDALPDVQLQVAIAARKIPGIDPIAVLGRVLSGGREDRLIPAIVWQNLHPLLEDRAEEFLRYLDKVDAKMSPRWLGVLPRAVERILSRKNGDPAVILALLEKVVKGSNADSELGQHCLGTLAAKIQNREIAGPALESLQKPLRSLFEPFLSGNETHPLHLEAVFLAATLRHPQGIEIARKLLASAKQSERIRLKALDALLAAGNAAVLDEVRPLLTNGGGSAEFRGQVLGSLSKLDEVRVAEVVLAAYSDLGPEIQSRAVVLLTQRPAWGKQLLQAIGQKKIPAQVLNVNHVRKLLAARDPELTRNVQAHWGVIREDRNPERDKVVAEMRTFLSKNPGDPMAGVQVFQKVCGQCHKIHGQGEEVGPDITANGRESFEQLLSNVFDPSLVIGAGYQATTVITTNGRALTGLLVEDGKQRVVLKLQGGKLETIVRGEIEDIQQSKVSLMPEGLEKQLQPRELADLFAFLAFDRNPSDPKSRKIPGAP